MKCPHCGEDTIPDKSALLYSFSFTLTDPELLCSACGGYSEFSVNTNKKLMYSVPLIVLYLLGSFFYGTMFSSYAFIPFVFLYGVIVRKNIIVRNCSADRKKNSSPLNIFSLQMMRAIFVVILGLNVIFISFSLLPDAPDFDESEIMLASANDGDLRDFGYLELVKLVNSIDDETLSADYDRWDDGTVEAKGNASEIIDEIESKYGEVFKRIELAITSPDKTISSTEDSGSGSSRNIRTLLTVSMLLHMYSADLVHENRMEEAVEKMMLAYDIGDALQRMAWQEVIWNLGSIIKRFTLEDLDEMLENEEFAVVAAGILKERLKESENLFREYAEMLQAEYRHTRTYADGMSYCKKNKTRKMVFDNYLFTIDAVGKPYTEIEFPEEGRSEKFWQFVCVISSTSLEELGNDLEEFYRDQTAYRLYLLKAASWQFYFDNGRLPATLDELVPAYLDHIPEDPYIVGSPLRYDSENEVLYSVAEDGADNNGEDYCPIFNYGCYGNSYDYSLSVWIDDEPTDIPDAFQDPASGTEKPMRSGLSSIHSE